MASISDELKTESGIDVILFAHAIPSLAAVFLYRAILHFPVSENISHFVHRWLIATVTAQYNFEYPKNKYSCNEQDMEM